MQATHVRTAPPVTMDRTDLPARALLDGPEPRAPQVKLQSTVVLQFILYKFSKKNACYYINNNNINKLTIHEIRLTLSS